MPAVEPTRIKLPGPSSCRRKPRAVRNVAVSALGGERAGARRADPAGAAGDEHPFAGQPRLHLWDSPRCDRGGARVDDVGGPRHGGRGPRDADRRRRLSSRCGARPRPRRPAARGRACVRAGRQEHGDAERRVLHRRRRASGRAAAAAARARPHASAHRAAARRRRRRRHRPDARTRARLLCAARPGSAYRCPVREAAERRSLRLRLAPDRPLDQFPLEHAQSGGGDMKVFIVSDMEGVAGILKWQQVDGSKAKRSYHEGRELYTEEINAAVRGARSGGAKEIVVMDCHGAGEEAVCREAKALLGDGLTTVAVKKGLGQSSARQFPPLKAREMIEDGAKEALKDLKAVQPYDPGRPCEIQVEFHTPARLVEYRNRKGTKQIDAHTLVSKADDWWMAWSQFYF